MNNQASQAWFSGRAIADLRKMARDHGLRSEGTREELEALLKDLKITGRQSPTKYRGISID